MKKIVLTLLAISLIASCSKKESLVNHSKNQDLPEWINENTETIGAVGIASPSKGGLKFQIPIAELDAKGNLASKISAEISRVTKNALRSANVNGSDDVEEFFAQATKEVVKDLPLNGVVRDKTFIAKDGTLYVHVTINKALYSKFLDEEENKLRKDLKKSGLSRENIKKGEEASKEIFDELEKERN